MPVSAFDALHVMRVSMRGQFSDEILREFIKLLGGLNAMSTGLDGAANIAGIMRVAG
jgi:hypothetical protein